MEGRTSGSRLAAIGDHIRDGLLRDNKVVPAVLGLLALLIFTWLIAGAIMGGPGEEEEAVQSSLGQGGQNSDSGSQETPAPGVENRDTDSYSAFESKDPFRSLVPKAEEGKAGEGKAGEGKTGEGKTGEGKTGESKGEESKSGEPKGGEPKGGEPKGSTPPRGDRPGATPPGGDRPSVIPPGEDRPSDASGGPGDGAPDGGDQTVPGDPNFGGGDPQGAPGQGGNGNLFNSGGDLPTP
jgi:uncharacterized low-complexity protein